MNSSLARTCAARGRMLHTSAPLIERPHPIKFLEDLGVKVVEVDRRNCLTANFGIRQFKRRFPEIKGSSMRHFKQNAWEAAARG